MTIYKGNHGILPRVALILWVLVLTCLASQTIQADPLMFSNTRVFQNNYLTEVELFSTPGVSVVGPNLTFRVDVTGTLPPGGTDTLQLTYNEAGSLSQVQTYQIPVFGSVSPPFTMFFSFVSPNATDHGVAATLTVALLNSSPDFVVPSGPDAGQTRDSHTYSFNVEPVPEPASILLFGSGLTVIASRRRRNRSS